MASMNCTSMLTGTLYIITVPLEHCIARPIGPAYARAVSAYRADLCSGLRNSLQLKNTERYPGTHADPVHAHPFIKSYLQGSDALHVHLTPSCGSLADIFKILCLTDVHPATRWLAEQPA